MKPLIVVEIYESGICFVVQNPKERKYTSRNEISYLSSDPYPRYQKNDKGYYIIPNYDSTISRRENIEIVDKLHLWNEAEAKRRRPRP